MMAKSWLGETVSDRYQIESLLGQGGMSAVYRAYDPNLRRVVAVKLIHPHLSENPHFVDRFKEEAAAVARLRHPNIVQVYDFNSDGDTYYMVLEFLAGETLQARLKRLNAAHWHLPYDEVIQIGGQICTAASYAHLHGLIHRDIKPANIMLDIHGQAILMDFGIVKIIGGDYHTATGATVGTAMYMSPEQIRAENIDERSDIYSIGVMLYEAVSGRPPFQADSAMTLMMMVLNDPLPDLRKLRPEAPEGLIAVIEKALAKNRKDRYQSAPELAAALQNAGANIVIPVAMATQVDEGATILDTSPGSEIVGGGFPQEKVAAAQAPSASPQSTQPNPLEPVEPGELPPISQPSLAKVEGQAAPEPQKTRRTWLLVAGAAIVLVIVAGLVALLAARRAPELSLAPIERPVTPVTDQNAPVVVSLGQWQIDADIEMLEFSPDSSLIGTANNRDWVRLTQYRHYSGLWQVEAGALSSYQQGHPLWITSAIFSPDGQLFATAGEDPQINLWRVSDGSLVSQIDTEDGGITNIAFSPNGLLLATSSWGTAIKLWQVSNGRLLRTLDGHTSSTLDVEFSPDGTLLASGSASDDNTIILWQVSDGQPLHTLQGHTDDIDDLEFSPDGALLASASEDHSVGLWQVSDGSLVKMLEGHEEQVSGVAFSPDGSLLASGSGDSILRLWRVSDGSFIRELTEQEDGIESVAFSPDGMLLAAGGGRGILQFWGISSVIPVEPAGQ